MCSLYILRVIRVIQNNGSSHYLRIFLFSEKKDLLIGITLWPQHAIATQLQYLTAIKTHLFQLWWREKANIIISTAHQGRGRNNPPSQAGGILRSAEAFWEAQSLYLVPLHGSPSWRKGLLLETTSPAREAGSSLTLMSLTKTKIYMQQPYLRQEHQGTTWGNRWQSPRQLSPNKKLGSTHHRSGPIPTAEAGLRYRDHKIMFACFVGKWWLWLRQAFGKNKETWVGHSNACIHVLFHSSYF